MEFKLFDRVQETSTSTGTGDITLAGAVTGFSTFSSRYSTGDTLYYGIHAVNSSGVPTGEWEIGLGTYSGANTLTRTTVMSSSNSDAAVSFSAGTKRVFVTMTAMQGAAIREKLTADRTYYVRTDGSDSNNGLANTSGGAFLTIQKAVDVVCNAIDIQNQNVTIQIGDGTYTTGAELKDITGNGIATIQGNSGTPGNVIISTTSASAINVSHFARGFWAIKDFRVQTTTSGNGITCQRGGFVTYTNIVFGSCAGSHISVQAGSTVICVGNYSIAGGATHHFNALYGGWLACNSRTITLTGTPAFSVAFAYAFNGGQIASGVCTFSGSATGTRYSAGLNGVIDTAGGGASYFPGNSAGTTATGGQYS